MRIVDEQVSGPSISLTPLIDVIFILLVFFMLASSFLDWQYLELGVGEPEAVYVEDSESSLIRIESKDRLLLDGEAAPLSEIVRNIGERLRVDPQHPVLVQPADDLPLQDLVDALDSLKDVAGANLSLVRDSTDD